MRQRRRRFDGGASLVAWVMAVNACDPATPGPASGRAPIDAAVDRVFLGVGAGGGSGGSSAGGTIPLTVDAGAADATRGDAGQGGAGDRLGGLGADGDGSGGTRATGGPGVTGGVGGMSESEGAGVSGGAGPPGAAGSPGPDGGGGRGGGAAPSIDPIDAMAPAPAVGDLAITELLINPAGTDTGREWIEISNQAAHAVDLANIHVADAINDAPIDFAILAGGPPTLPAGARAVLIQSPDATKNGGVTLGAGGLVLVGGAFGTRVSLNNGGDTISVCAGPCAEGVVLDSVAWDAALGATYEGHALSIDDRGRRCPATAAFGDAGSFGTPGAPNPLCP